MQYTLPLAEKLMALETKIGVGTDKAARAQFYQKYAASIAHPDHNFLSYAHRIHALNLEVARRGSPPVTTATPPVAAAAPVARITAPVAARTPAPAPATAPSVNPDGKDARRERMLASMAADRAKEAEERKDLIARGIIADPAKRGIPRGGR